MIRVAEIFSSRRVALQLPLGYASGLPLLLSGSTLATWMATEGVNLKTIGAFALAGLSYSLKFLWAPLLDRYPLPLAKSWGRRRGWLLLTQLLTALAIAALGLSRPAEAPTVTAACAALLAFCSASQDIVCDAYRTDVLRSEERAAGVATFILGYRVGMLAAGALALVLVRRLGWRHVHLALAASMVVGVVATLFAPNEVESRYRPRRLVDAFVKPLVDLAARPGAVRILCFVMLFRFGYAVASQMNSPFLVRTGYTLAEIAVVQKGVGLVSTLLGGLVAGALVARLGMRRSLLGFGLCQALVHLAWVGLALLSGPNHLAHAATVGVDNFFGGLASTAFDAWLMSLCNPAFSAAQFAALTSLTSLGGRLFASQSGWLAEVVGWPAFFGVTVVMASLALLLIPFLPRRSLDPQAASTDSALPVAEAADSAD